MRAYRIAALLLAAAGSAGAPASAAPAPAAPGRPLFEVPKGEFGGATAINERNWFGFEDYPMDALRRGEQGYATVAFDILASGRVGACRVVRSSGSAAIDAVPCRLLVKRARFVPARDAAGNAIATTGRWSLAFWTPQG